MNYHSVRMGRLDRFVGPTVYSFPSRKAAIEYATTESQMHPRRVVIVRDPSGQTIKRFGKTNQRRKSAA